MDENPLENPLVEPGDYPIEGGGTLRIWVSGGQTWAAVAAAFDGSPSYPWHPRQVTDQEDGTLNALLANVIMGRMKCEQDEHGVFQFQVTERGKARIREMTVQGAITFSPPGQEGVDGSHRALGADG
jgi:hypothetical protein